MTKLPFNWGTLDWGDWIKGLITAFISGGSTAVTTTFTASLLSKDFQPGSGKFFTLAASVFGISGFMSMMAFLRTKSFPEAKLYPPETPLPPAPLPPNIHQLPLTGGAIEPSNPPQ